MGPVPRRVCTPGTVGPALGPTAWWGGVQTAHRQGHGPCRSRGTLGRNRNRSWCQAGKHRQGAGGAGRGVPGEPPRDIRVSRGLREVRSPAVQSGLCILARTPALTLGRKGITAGFPVKRHGLAYVLEGCPGCPLRMSRPGVHGGDRGGHHDAPRQR